MTTTTISTSRRSSSDRPLSSARSLTIPRPYGPDVHVRWSVRADGDFHRTEVPLAALEPRRRALVDLPWTMLDEHHGVLVRRVVFPGEHDGSFGDVAITGALDAVLGCWVGDCAAIVLVGATDEVAVVHAGWRGLAARVIDVAVAAFDEPIVAAVLGPCIGPCCYEFGADDLAAVACGVRAAPGELTGATHDGATALDVPAAVRAALGRYGLDPVVLAGCTGCSFDGFSHRVRNERARHVVAAWQGSAP
jgi:copper oxidase (laccase) domain-containing protein